MTTKDGTAERMLTFQRGSVIGATILYYHRCTGKSYFDVEHFVQLKIVLINVAMIPRAYLYYIIDLLDSA